jgi:hypothetical protein
VPERCAAEVMRATKPLLRQKRMISSESVATINLLELTNGAALPDTPSQQRHARDLAQHFAGQARRSQPRRNYSDDLHAPSFACSNGV